jgi:tetratricopeptide (TPR) repeat protein
MAQKAFVRGMQAFKMADFKGAVGFFQAAAEYDPESEPQYHLKLAQSLMKSRGSFTKAIEHAERACEMDPYKVEFKIVLAEVHETVGALSKAREIYEDVLRWDGNNQQAKLQIQLLDERMGPQDKSPLVRKIKTLINKYSKKK